MQRSDSTFGLDPTEWEQAKTELRRAIEDAARREQTISYGDAAREVRVVHVEPHSALMSHLLGEIFRDEHAAGRPALTAIVTHKDGDKEPGPGFYEMARSLGYKFTEPYLFWSDQVKEVFALHVRRRHGE